MTLVKIQLSILEKIMKNCRFMVVWVGLALFFLEGTVTYLNESSLENFLAQNNYALINMCSKSLLEEPEWGTIMDDLAFSLSKVSEVKLAKYEPKKDEEVCKNFGKSERNFKLYVSGHPIGFPNSPKVLNLADFILTKPYTILREVFNTKQMQKVLEEESAIIYFVPRTDAKALFHYEIAVEYFLNKRFFYSHDKNLRLSFNSPKNYALVISRNKKKDLRVYSSRVPFKTKRIRQILWKFRYPLILQDQEEILKLANEGSNEMVVFFSDSQDDNFLQKALKFARKNENWAKIAVSPVENSLVAEFFNGVDLDLVKEGSLRFLFTHKGEQHRFNCDDQKLSSCIFKARNGLTSGYQTKVKMRAWVFWIEKFGRIFKSLWPR